MTTASARAIHLPIPLQHGFVPSLSRLFSSVFSGLVRHLARDAQYRFVPRFVTAILRRRRN
jgi:hypothetical protein